MQRFRRGLTLIESMMLMVIVSIAAVGVGVGLQSSAKIPAKTDDLMAGNSVILSVMEQTKANLVKNWPSSTWGGSNYAFTANGLGYTPTSNLSLGASPGSSAGYSTPTTGSSPAPLTINNKTYQLTLSLDKADPAIGTSYKSDFFQVTVQLCPVISGSVNSTAPQKMVTYVAQP